MNGEGERRGMSGEGWRREVSSEEARKQVSGEEWMMNSEEMSEGELRGSSANGRGSSLQKRSPDRSPKDEYLFLTLLLLFLYFFFFLLPLLSLFSSLFFY